MPLLARAEQIHILHVSEVQEEPQGSPPAERLAEFLRRHGMKPEVNKLSSNGRDPVEVLLATAERNLQAGLLVMGAYGHSRAREFIFGGFTRTVLHDAPLPVLLSH
jgi:nucleotide-binding universal stress UspA family protein